MLVAESPRENHENKSKFLDNLFFKSFFFFVNLSRALFLKPWIKTNRLLSYIAALDYDQNI